MIITAPHHGSEANKYAYERFKNENPNNDLNVFWIRSDGRFKKRPYCILCRGCIYSKQDIHFFYYKKHIE